MIVSSDDNLPEQAGFTKAELLNKMKDKIIEQTQLVGLCSAQ